MYKRSVFQSPRNVYKAGFKGNGVNCIGKSKFVLFNNITKAPEFESLLHGDIRIV